MSDFEAGTPASGGRASAWTETDKNEFYLWIILQLKDGKSISWSKIHMPGRTTKALQNQWTKVQKQLSELETRVNDNSTAPKKTPQTRTPLKKKVDLVAQDEGGSNDEQDTPSKASKKRATTGKTASRKKIKVDDEDEAVLKIENDDEAEDFEI